MSKFFSYFIIFSFCSNLFGVGLLVYPMQHEVKVGESATYIASNQLDTALAIEVIAEEWTISPDGKEMRTPTKDLVIYPSQFILKGHTYKKIKVGQRNPDRNQTQERAYRVTIRELPISLEPEQPGTYRIYHASGYRTSYYVKPKDAKPSVAVLGASWSAGQLAVTIENNGNSHIHLRNPLLYLSTAEGKRIEIVDQELLKPMNGHNMHAGSVRHFRFDLSELGVEDQLEGLQFLFQDNGYLQPHVYQSPITVE